MPNQKEGMEKTMNKFLTHPRTAMLIASTVTLSLVGATGAHAILSNKQSLQAPKPGVLLNVTQSSGHSHNHAHDHHSVRVGDLEIIAPVIRSTPPSAPVSAGYMTITNHGSEADRLVGGSAAFAARVEVHDMKLDGDVMKMHKLNGGLEIPAGGSVTLKPGGLHIMFMKLTERMHAGDKHAVTLVFEKAGTVELELPVKQIKGGHKHSGKHDH